MSVIEHLIAQAYHHIYGPNNDPTQPNQKDTDMNTWNELNSDTSLDVYTVELNYDELQLVMKATQISLTHAGGRIQRTTGRQLDAARHDYTTLSSAVAELQMALDEALGVA